MSMNYFLCQLGLAPSSRNAAGMRPREAQAHLRADSAPGSWGWMTRLPCASRLAGPPMGLQPCLCPPGTPQLAAWPLLKPRAATRRPQGLPMVWLQPGGQAVVSPVADLDRSGDAASPAFLEVIWSPSHWAMVTVCSKQLQRAGFPQVWSG